MIMDRTDTEIYRDAIRWLFSNSYGKTAQAEEQVFELFYKLLDRGHSIGTDSVKDLCVEAGYSKYDVQNIATVYDYMFMWNSATISYWTDEMIAKIERGDVPV